MDRNKVVFWALLITVLTTTGSGLYAVYVQFDTVKMRVDANAATFYLKNGAYWNIAGVEEMRLYDGSSIMNRDTSGIVVSSWNDSVFYYIKRITPFIRGPIVEEIWKFKGDITDKEMFPIMHEIHVIGASGKFLRYAIDDLKVYPPKRKLSGETTIALGNNMKVDLNPNYRWAHIGWPYGADSVSAQYDINSDFEVFNFRLYDPVLDRPWFVGVGNKEDYFKIEKTEVFLDRAYTEYYECNPTVSTLTVEEKNFSAYFPYGSEHVKSWKKEYLNESEEQYMSYEKNGSLYIIDEGCDKNLTCYNNTGLVDTFGYVKKTRKANTWVEGTIETKSSKCVLVRITGELDVVVGERNIEHVPVIYGESFIEHDWWNFTAPYRMTLGNGTSGTTTIPYYIYDDNITGALRDTRNSFEEVGWMTTTSWTATDNCHYSASVASRMIDRTYPANAGSSAWEGFGACGCNQNTFMTLDMGSLRNISQVIIYVRNDRDSNLNVTYSTDCSGFVDYDSMTLGEVQALALEPRQGGDTNAHVARLNNSVTAQCIRVQIDDTEAGSCDLDLWEIFVELEDNDTLWYFDGTGNEYIYFNTTAGNMTVYADNFTTADPDTNINSSSLKSIVPIFDTAIRFYYSGDLSDFGSNYYDMWNNPALADWLSIGTEEVPPFIYNVTLLSPADSSTTSGSGFTFKYNGTMSTSSCELLINGVGYGVNASTLNDTATTITANVTLTDKSYDWWVNCTTQMSDQNWTVTIDTSSVLLLNGSSNTVFFEIVSTINITAYYNFPGGEICISINRTDLINVNCSTSSVEYFLMAEGISDLVNSSTTFNVTKDADLYFGSERDFTNLTFNITGYTYSSGEFNDSTTESNLTITRQNTTHQFGLGLTNSTGTLTDATINLTGYKIPEGTYLFTLNETPCESVGSSPSRFNGIGNQGDYVYGLCYQNDAGNVNYVWSVVLWKNNGSQVAKYNLSDDANVPTTTSGNFIYGHHVNDSAMFYYQQGANKLYTFSLTGGYVRNDTLGAACTSCASLTGNDTYFWLASGAGAAAEVVYQYYWNRSSIGNTDISSVCSSNNLRGYTTNTTYMWVSCGDSNRTYKLFPNQTSTTQYFEDKITSTIYGGYLTSDDYYFYYSHYVSETDLQKLRLIETFPYNVSVRIVGKPTTTIITGELISEQNVTLSLSELEEYRDESCSTLLGSVCSIPLNITSHTEGIILFDNYTIEADSYPRNITFDIDKDGFTDLWYPGILQGATFYINETTDGDSQHNITYGNSGTQTLSFTVAKNTTITLANLTLTGFDSSTDVSTFRDFDGELTGSLERKFSYFQSSGSSACDNPRAISGTELGDTDYENIWADDGSYAETSRTETSTGACRVFYHIFEFTIPDDPDDVVNFTIELNGRAKPKVVTAPAILQVYNFTANAYETLESKTNTDSFQLYSGSKLAGMSDYIYNNRLIAAFFMETGRVSGETYYVRTDYINMTMNINQSAPTNISVDTTFNGNTDYSLSNELNDTTSPVEFDLNITVIQQFIDSMTTDFSEFEVAISSETSGIIRVDDIDIRYTTEKINVTGTTGSVGYAAYIHGNSEISNVDAYFDGNMEYNITTNGSSTITFSKWTNFTTVDPNDWANEIIFYAFSNTSYNDTPWGQTDTVPAYNVTNVVSHNATFGMLINSSADNCMNITVSNTSNKNDGFILNTTYNTVRINQTSGGSFSLFMWRDMINCTGGLYTLYPYMAATCDICLPWW